MNVPKTIRQVRMHSYGGPEVLQLEQVPTPALPPGHVLLRVGSIGVNYSDILRRRNTYFMPTPLPYVPGAEVVGEIIAAAEGAGEHLAIGTRVLAILPAGAGYADHVVAVGQFCVPLPPQVDGDQATALFVQGTTAHMLAGRMADTQGRNVLVHAGASGVGTLLIQFLRMNNAARIVATVGSANKMATAKAAGADAVVDYSATDWSEQAKQANGCSKFDVIYEMVGGGVFDTSVELLEGGGTLVVYGAASGVQGTVHSERLVDDNLRVVAFNLAHQVQHANEAWQRSLGAVIGLLAEGRLHVTVGARFSLSNAADAHRALEGRSVVGKVVLKP